MRVDVWEVQRRILACPLVTGVHTGPFGRIITRTSAGPVVGVAAAPAMIVVGAQCRAPGDADDYLGLQVRSAVASLVPAVPVSVCVRPQRDPTFPHDPAGPASSAPGGPAEPVAPEGVDRWLYP